MRHLRTSFAVALLACVAAGQAQAHNHASPERPQLWATAHVDQAVSALGAPARSYRVAHRNVYVWTGNGGATRAIHFDTAGNITRTRNLPRHMAAPGS